MSCLVEISIKQASSIPGAECPGNDLLGCASRGIGLSSAGGIRRTASHLHGPRGLSTPFGRSPTIQSRWPFGPYQPPPRPWYRCQRTGPARSLLLASLEAAFDARAPAATSRRGDTATPRD